MLETYDTQMLDYPNDIDVAMHASSSDPWFIEEAVMEDDGQGLPLQKQNSLAHSDNVSIEVDMDHEPYVEDDGEYEMADGAETYEVDNEDSVDIEVYDASRAHTPQHIPGFVLSPVPYSFGETVSANTFPIILHSDVPLVHAQLPSDKNVQELSGIPEDKLIDVTGDTLPTASPLFDSLAGDIDSNHHIDEHAAPHSGPRLGNVGTAQDSVYVEEAAANADAPEADESSGGAEDAAADNNDDTEKQREVQPPENLDEHHGLQDPVSIEHLHADQLQDGLVQSARDPHEISEGVYIDPPPAVLLSLPSSEQPTISLFNQPIFSRGSPSPSADGDHSNLALTLLLHDRPTLYYEPLTSVFEALRLEESINSALDLENGEIVFNAYDLQLAVSEDNLYAREVTLHDLNVLHDGSDITGPLRLRLEFVTPRFIIRYHLLQDQIARLNLATQSDEGYVEEVAESNDDERPEYNDSNLGDQEATGHEITQNQEPSSTPQKVENSAAQQGRDAPVPTQSLNIEVGTGAPHEDEESGLEPDTKQDGDELGVGASAVDGAQNEEYADPQDSGDYNDGETWQEDSEKQDDYVSETLYQSLEPHPPDEVAAGEVSTVHEEVATTNESELVSVPDIPADSADAHVDGVNQANTPEITSAEINTESITEPANYDIQSGSEAVGSESIIHADHPSDVHGSELPTHGQAPIVETEISELPELPDEEWDDSLDGEGEPDLNWEADNDAASYESSVTLSSKASTKRTIDDVEPDDQLDTASPEASPDPKRPRVH